MGMLYRIRLGLITCIFFLSINLFAQNNYNVSGYVFDAITNKPLEGVSVIFGDNAGVLTQSNGEFAFMADTSKISVTYRFLGYKSIIEKYSIQTLADTYCVKVFLEPAIEELEEVVVSASKTEEKISNLTVSMVTVTTDRLARNHTIHAEDLISKIPGVEILDGQASIRGGSGYSYGAGSRVLILVDGLPVLATDAGNVKWYFLPLESVSKIEILKGASSVLYGSSALNGVINFRTTKTVDHPFTKVLIQTGIYDAPRNKNWKWWDAPRTFYNASFFHARKIYANDFGIGFTINDDRGYRTDNAKSLARINVKWNRNSKQLPGLRYGLNIHTMLTRRSDFVLWQDADSGALIQNPQNILKQEGFGITADPYIYYSHSPKYMHEFQSRFQLTMNNYPKNTNNNSDAYSFYSEYRFVYKPLDQLSINLGITEMYNSILSSFYGNHNGINVAGYTQFNYTPINKLKTVAGIRFEHYALDGNEDGVKPIFRAGVNYKLLKFTFLRASFGQGYRYPSIAEKHAFTTLGAVRIFPNPEILPESGWSAELGLKQGVSLAGYRGQFDLAAFYTQNVDLIQYEFGIYTLSDSLVADYGFKALNIENSRVYGFEIEMAFTKSIQNLLLGIDGGYTFIHPVEFNPVSSQTSEVYLKYRNKSTAKLLLFSSYKKWDGQLTYIYKSKMLNIDNVFLHPLTREQFLPGFYEYWRGHNTGHSVIDIQVGYRIVKNSTLSFSVKNVLNTEYMGRPGDIQPPRNYSLQYKLLL